MRNRTLFGSLLLIGVMVAALAGGSYAIFTDTESAHVKFEAGSIEITVDGDVFTEEFLVPGEFDDWKPGDYEEWPIHIVNHGNKAWIQIYIYPTPPWDATKPNFWDVAEFGVEPSEDWNQWILEEGGELDLTLWVDFPQTVGNDYEEAQGDLLILVVAKQYRNKFEEGFSCVALENKDSNFLPILGDELEGIVCYKVVGDELLVDVNGYGLIPGEYYQLALNGPGGGPNCDNFVDVSFAGMDTSLYHSGWYQYNPGQLAPTCTASWNEGVWNFSGTDGEVQATDPDNDGLGSISWGGALAGLPDGDYEKVKFVVKLIDGYAGSAPSHSDHGTSWTPVLVEMDYLSFIIPAGP